MKTSVQNSKTKKLQQISQMLEDGVAQMFESEMYSQWLKTLAQFHKYSLNNTMLICMQKPDATYVTGFASWKVLNRNVKKGEKGILILAPCPYKKQVEREFVNENGETVKKQAELSLLGFKPVYVFDYSQTEGEPLPELCSELIADVENYDELFTALENSSPVPVRFDNIQSGAKGYYDDSAKGIVLHCNMSQQQTIKTLIHEIAHARLHNKEFLKEHDLCPDRETKEVQAESIAFVVCKWLGIDTDEYSFGYIAGWSSNKEAEALRASLKVIQETSSAMIDNVDTFLHCK